MTKFRLFCAAALTLGAVIPAQSQQPAQPGAEHKQLSKLAGTWDCTMEVAGQKSKATAVYKMELGGLWLVSNFEGDMMGQKFSGKGLDSYDASKKKYVSVWFDSMSSVPMVMEGNWDEAKKTMTMEGMAPGMDGKMTKHKIVTVIPDDNTMNFAMYAGDVKEPAFTIVYKRKK